MARWLSAILWLAACLLASYVAVSYDFSAGRLGPRQAGWPANTALPRDAGKTTVVAFLHPKCPCTRATVKQLIRALEGQPDVVLIAPVFVPPAGDSREWEAGEYVETIRAKAPRARIFFDPGGGEARRFGALTSGTVLVYDEGGAEVFRGGITDRRGGEGNNPGLRRLGLALAGKPHAPRRPTPVFGCPLVPPDEPIDRGGEK